MIDHGLELYQSLQNSESDCFKRATLRLTNGCDGLQFGTQENMDYAIMLTLCELETAQIAIPVECKPLVNDTKDRNRHVENLMCNSKIAKIPQTWTTYSAIMCYALHHPIHKDLLEKLHINITLNQVKNFEILQKQQQLLINWKNEEFKRLERLKSSQTQVLSQIKNVQAFHARSASQIEQIFETLVLLHKQTEIIVSDYNKIIKTHVENMHNKLNQLANKQEDELERAVDIVRNGLRLIDHNVEEMVHMQQDALARWAHAQDAQIKHMKSWKESLDETNMNLQQSLKSSLEKVDLLKQDVFIIHTQVKRVLAPIQWTNNVIENFRKQALDIMVFCSFFSIAATALRSYNPYTAFFLSFAASVAHQHVFNYLCSRDPSRPNSIGFKLWIILFEWLLQAVLEAVFKFIKICLEKSRPTPIHLSTSSSNSSSSSGSSSIASSISSSSNSSSLDSIPLSGSHHGSSSNSRTTSSGSSTDYGGSLRGGRFTNGNASKTVQTYLRNNPANR
ncbi:hypothetical protein BD770DRAFT_440828 [Pilaira anomala]|nr:hypothetical protein BD770DRAFT_440828 [Pilaira anomala]